MAKTIPKWADLELSEGLPEVRQKGESGSIEFKEDFPSQSHDLAKELAALATSGGGALYIGIDDGGELKGVDARDGDQRDNLVNRAHGIVSAIDPVPAVEIRFVVDTGRTILVLRLPKQDEPVYYYGHRPYIRDGRNSRPARPEEVKERIWSHRSSHYHRRIEELKLQQVQSIVDHSRHQDEFFSEIRSQFLGPR